MDGNQLDAQMSGVRKDKDGMLRKYYKDPSIVLGRMNTKDMSGELHHLKVDLLTAWMLCTQVL
jgi:hypothetical protein